MASQPASSDGTPRRVTNRSFHPVDTIWTGNSAPPEWDKRTARRTILSVRNNLPSAFRREASFRARLNLLSFLEGKTEPKLPLSSRRTFSLFHSFGTEVDTHPLFPVLFEAGFRVLIPSLSRQGTLLLLPWHPDISLRPGPFGILEPDSGEPVSPRDVDLFLVPGIGFDPEGHRLGYGKGYYDRLLSSANQEGLRIGLAFSKQVVPIIPSEDNDVPVNVLITEKGFFSCG